MGTSTIARVAWSGHWIGRWCVRHRRWLALWLVIAALCWLTGSRCAGLLLAPGIVPGLIGCLWAGLAPRSYERLVAGPARRFGWWRFARLRWQRLARVCGLADRQVVRSSRAGHGWIEETRWVAPRLRRVHTMRHCVRLTIRARAGQTLTELETGAERLATTFAAVAHRVWPVAGAGSGCTVVVELVMTDVLMQSAHAIEPEPRAITEAVPLGRTQAGGDWRLRLRGRHTLVAGCSGSGKGSILWGVCCGLAPAVRADMARMWGIDLKRGVELAMGERLFSTRAYTPTDALAVLRALMAVIDERGQQMAGSTRLHEPTVGDPLHVLVIDELAALTAYADLEVRREANRLLAEVLTQGRALGVVVVACVQDPRKDVVAMRGLFTQTVALRLRSVEETVMVLGDGMSRIAPAHRISPLVPGTAWVVDDTGAADRVRADYWPDPLIRDLSTRYASTVHHDHSVDHDQMDHSGHSVPSPADSDLTDPAVVTRLTVVDRPGSDVNGDEGRRPRRPRSARRARKPRRPRDPGVGVAEVPDGAA